MKTIVRLSLVISVLLATVWAGGVVTNTNQSAAFIRTLNRNASTEVDAAYFNPAGLTKLADGIYVDIANQSIWQKKTITNSYQLLKKNEFVGNVQVLTFPTAYVVYKKSKLAVAAGVMPIGGGGSAEYDKGLPSFEIPVSNLKAALASQGVNDYTLDVSFSGSSIYLGAQGGVAYKVNDMLSVFGGARYVLAGNTYTGHLEDIRINPAGNWMKAFDFFTAAATQYAGAASSIQTLVTAAPNITLAQAQAAGYLTATQVAQLEGGLAGVGYNNTWTVAQVQAAYNGLATTMTGHANEVADKEVDAKRNGSGVGMIIGANISPFKGMDIGIRYETITKMVLKNDTKKDDTGLFPDEAEYHADIPAMLAVGVAYKVTPRLKVMSDFNYFFNTAVDWDSAEVNFENGYEVGAAFEYALTSKLRVSAGYLFSKQGATDKAQSDMDFNLDCSTVGFGLAYAIKPGLDLNLGALNAFYKEGKNAAGTEKYKQTTTAFGVGLQVKL